MRAVADSGAVIKDAAAKSELFESIRRLTQWLETNDYSAYDVFDGLNAGLVRPLTFNSKVLRTVLQQGVRRFPLNLRPVLGIRKSRSTKGMGFLARGFMRLDDATADPAWRRRAETALAWLEENQSGGYSGACWGNHFDYQSRSFYLPKGVPTIVWTSLIGHAFLDSYERYGNTSHLNVAVSSCEHILRDLDRFVEGNGVCISYIPGMNKQVHNANTLGASLLARTYAHTRTELYKTIAGEAIQYTAQNQHADGSWYYGEPSNLHWIDNFHTAYVLDCFHHYRKGAGDTRFDQCMARGYEYWKSTFFLEDGTPRYYHDKTLPADIQCCSQAIDTLVLFNQYDPDNLALALRVAGWTITHMQDPSGYFYYRRYSRRMVNKTPTLHWGQATMLCALAGLYKRL
jgi:polysaccharide biosynthesis protein VpsJ